MSAQRWRGIQIVIRWVFYQRIVEETVLIKGGNKMSVSMKIDINFNIEFNNTDLKQQDLQYGFKEVIEKGYRQLNSITEKYYDEYESGVEIVEFVKNDESFFVEMYAKVKNLSVKFVCLKSFRDKEYYIKEDKDIYIVYLK